MATKVVLFVDHASAIGGAENSLLLLLTYLDRRQWDLHLATAGGPLLQKATPLGIACHLLDMPRLKRKYNSPLIWWQQARKLADLAEEIQAEIIYANTVRAAMYSVLAARLAKRPFIWHMRDFWLSETMPSRVWADTAVKNIIGNQASQIIANSHAVADYLPASNKTAVVHNGIEVQTFDPALDGRPFRQQNHIPDKAPLIGMVGRLRPWKGQMAFLKMASLLLDIHPGCYFVIVGGATFAVTDPYPQQLHQFAQDLGIQERVIFTGALQDVRPALAAFDIFVHPGEPEPFGLVNVEAMAMQKPVVAFKHGALPEIVADQETGRLAEPGNVQALAQATASLIKDKELALNLGKNGRNRAQTHFTIQQTAHKIEQILLQIGENS